MKNFTFQNPTKLIFGKGSIGKLRAEIPTGNKILMTYGGGSIIKNGIYQQVLEQLEGYEVVPFGGIEPNPDASTVDQAIAKYRAEECHFILAVGGGSVIDASKAIALGVNADISCWEMVTSGYRGNSAPLGTVLTVPATGSEMNSGAVISNRATEEKYPMVGDFPRFSILDPTYTYTLSQHQVACGIADTFMHTLEQYLTFPGQSGVMDRMAEGVLLNLLDIAPQLIKKHDDYDTAAEYMLSATMGLNHFLSMGVEEDWLTHMIGHEVTALTGTTHGASLMMLLPSVMRVMVQEKRGKIIQMGHRVFGIRDLSDEATAEATITAVVDFIHSLGLSASLKEGGIDASVAEEIALRFEQRQLKLGTLGSGTPDKIRKILEMALQ
ncbi:MAG: iron-containing alcohol dehydrogenase [Porphyromonas sp.]|nr:iron-containing alcohol dehydrogenase [Porphyromonas sp.]